jgi:hypothetical protein
MVNPSFRMPREQEPINLLPSLPKQHDLTLKKRIIPFAMTPEVSIVGYFNETFLDGSDS